VTNDVKSVEDGTEVVDDVVEKVVEGVITILADLESDEKVNEDQDKIVTNDVNSVEDRTEAVDDVVENLVEGVITILADLESEEKVNEDQDKTVTNDVKSVEDGTEAIDNVVEKLVEGVITTLVDLESEENNVECKEVIVNTEELDMSPNQVLIEEENVCCYMDCVSTQEEEKCLSVSPEDPVLAIGEPDQAMKPFSHLTQFLMDPVPPVSSLNISDMNILSHTMARIQEIQAQIVKTWFEDKA